MIPQLLKIMTEPYDADLRWNISTCHYPEEHRNDVVASMMDEYRVSANVVKPLPHPITAEEISYQMIRLGAPYKGETYESR